MNRYKFRAWDKTLKQMFKVDCLDFSQWWVQCERPIDAPRVNGNAFYGERNSFKNEETDRHILMQCTGLKDKVNQKEIYECDIVKALNRAYDNEDNWKERFQTFRVTYLNGCYMFGNWNAHEFFNRFIYIEVVGNKFENSDLWEEAK